MALLRVDRGLVVAQPEAREQAPVPAGGPRARSLEFHLSKRGGPIRLRRVEGLTLLRDVATVGFLGRVNPGEFQGPIQQDDELLVLSARRLAAAGWEGGVGDGDNVLVDDDTRAVLAGNPMREGGAIIGYRAWLRGSA